MSKKHFLHVLHMYYKLLLYWSKQKQYSFITKLYCTKVNKNVLFSNFPIYSFSNLLKKIMYKVKCQTF